MVYIPHVHYTHCNMYCIHTVNKICMNLASEIQCHDNFIHALQNKGQQRWKTSKNCTWHGIKSLGIAQGMYLSPVALN